jgi:hypothetical protein
MAGWFVYVIESPRDTDLLDGRSEGQALCSALKLAEIPHFYSLVTTPNSFEVSLGERLAEASAKSEGRLPILHFSMHGNKEGVALTNGKFLTWGDLRTALQPLIERLEGELVVCMSSCHGHWAMNMALNEDPARPYGALIGNAADANWSDSAVAFIAFYHRLFSGASLEESVSAMRAASGDNNFFLTDGSRVKSAWTTMMDRARSANLVAALRGMPPQQGALARLFTDEPVLPEPRGALSRVFDSTEPKT